MRPNREPDSSNRVYGISLEDAYKKSCGELPAIVRESVAVLRLYGLNCQGLFRGQYDLLKLPLLEKAWRQGRNPLKLANIRDSHTVAESLLQWLRSLPAPVIPCRLFPAFIKIQFSASPTQTLHQLHFLFNQMEEWDLQLLDFLLSFLHDYQTSQQSLGFMPPSLGQTFAPQLLRAHEGPLPLPFPEDLRAAAQVIDHLITDFNVVFRPPQSSPSSPVQKPPSRARNRLPSITKQELAALEGLSAQRPISPGSSFAAKMVPVNPTPPHLRINVQSRDPDASGLSEQHEKAPKAARFNPIKPRLGSLEEKLHLRTVPETEIVDTHLLPQGSDLDVVVGSLMSDSLEGTLFEADDGAFLRRTTSLISTPSLNTPRQNSESSTEVSSDDENLAFPLEMRGSLPWESPEKPKRGKVSPAWACDSLPGLK